MNYVYEDLYQYVVKQHLAEGQQDAVDAAFDFITSGILDGEALLDMAQHMTETYHIDCAPEEITPDNFATLAAMEQYVNDKMTAANRRQWEKWWQDSDVRHQWQIAQMPEVLIKAVERGWFPKGGSLLDIGCGDGEMSKWLAEQGFDVLGFDFSEQVIERAKSVYGEEAGQLAFAAYDATQLPQPNRLFDALYDRGCFHTIDYRRAYQFAKSIASWAKPNARFLLMNVCDVTMDANTPETGSQTD